MSIEPDTLPPRLAEELMRVAGAVNALFSDSGDPEPRIFWADGRRELVATGRVEPLYTWHPGRIEWTTRRRELVRDWPPPSRERADDLAHGMAAALGAFCSAPQAPPEAPSVPYVAVFDVQIVPARKGSTLEREIQRSTHQVLLALVAKLHVLHSASGAKAGPILERYVHDHAAFFRVTGAVLAQGLAVAPALGAIASELAARAPRMKAAGDEPGRAYSEIAIAADAWARSCGLS